MVYNYKYYCTSNQRVDMVRSVTVTVDHASTVKVKSGLFWSFVAPLTSNM